MTLLLIALCFLLAMAGYVWWGIGIVTFFIVLAMLMGVDG